MTAFVRYLQARHNRDIIDRSYRYYVTDSLRLIPQMAYLDKRWQDVLRGAAEVEKTAEEIVDDVTARLEE